MNNSPIWINAGYELFAQEGHEGLQVERLARILGLNKSGFYHYFGGHDVYFEHLVQHHHHMVDKLIKDLEYIHHFDPDYLLLMIKHHTTVMASIQLARNRHVRLFEKAFNEVSDKVDRAILPFWANYLGLSDHSGLAMRYYQMTRDVFYARVNFDNLNYEFLHGIMMEAKMMMEEMRHMESFSSYSSLMEISA